jgi:hypothetical protein
MLFNLKIALVQIGILLFFSGLILLFPWYARKGWPRRIALSGFFLPVLIGMFVRQYLWMLGKPVMPWTWILSWFYRPLQLMYLLAVLAYWDVPFLVVAALAGKLPLYQAKNRWLVSAGYVGTLLSTFLVFGYLWRDTEAVLMGIPVIPFAVILGTFLGLGVGWVFGHSQHQTAYPGQVAHP